MYREIMTIWSRNARLLWCSRVAPELGNADVIGKKYTDWNADKKAASARFAQAIGGVPYLGVADLTLAGQVVRYQTTLERVAGSSVLVGTGRRVHPRLPDMTARELDIFGLLTELEPVDIAIRLGMSRSTFDSHRRRMRAKLGCANNSQLIALAARCE